MIRVARFLSTYLRHPSPAVVVEEDALPVEGSRVEASLFRPAGGGPRPGWVVLHGITVPGRRHPALVRFASALAGSGATVLVPDIPPWRELRVDPVAADATIAASARHLAQHPAVRGGGVGVVGFSFGATQALVTASRPELRDVLRAVVGFGGYCDLERTLRFMLTGEHEWRGIRYRLEPDPYGRWIVAANYLTSVPEYAGMQALADAARELAAEAGREGAYAGDARYDATKARLRERLSDAEREIWSLIAPPTGAAPPPGPTRELADHLVHAALRVHPALDPHPVLPALDRTVVLAHGQDDHLVPFTETLRLQALLEPHADVSATITRLFAHSGGADRLPLRHYPGEALRYLRLLARALRV
jgi:pimeloyl-ACP methyl ester carboxylesterase